MCFHYGYPIFCVYDSEDLRQTFCWPMGKPPGSLETIQENAFNCFSFFHFTMDVGCELFHGLHGYKMSLQSLHRINPHMKAHMHKNTHRKHANTYKHSRTALKKSSMNYVNQREKGVSTRKSAVRREKIPSRISTIKCFSCFLDNTTNAMLSC